MERPFGRTGLLAARPGSVAVIVLVVALLVFSGGSLVARHPTTAGFPASAGPAAPASAGGKIICIICLLQNGWTNVTATGADAAPPAAFGGTAAFDVQDNETVYFGGCYAYGCATASNATWVFANGIWTNLTNPANSPPARDYAAMDYDANMHGVLMFGGTGQDGGYRNDTWLFSAGAWTNVSSYSVAPPARSGAAMAFDPQPEENGSVLFGGYGPSVGYFNDTWIWEGGAGWVKLVTSSIAPPAVDLTSMAYDAANGYVVQFGGYLESGGDDRQTWELYSGEWWNVTPSTSPPARSYADMVYDPSLSGVLLFGGFSYETEEQNNQTWLFDNGAWSERSPPTVPPGLDSCGFALADNGTVPILIGGFNQTSGDPVNETWAYEDAPSVDLTPSNSTDEVGEIVTFTASVVIGQGPFRATFTFGDGGSAEVSSTSRSLSVDHVYTTNGTFDASVVVADGVDATGSDLRVPITVSLGPKISAAVSPTMADVGSQVSFTSSVLAKGAGSLTYRWQFGDGAIATVANTTHTYTKTGTYNVSVVATDASTASVTVNLTVTVVADPSVSASASPRQPYAGEMTRFYGNVSGGVGPYTYAWSFGDHNTSSLPDPVHIYNATGTYSVQLWVNDSGGASTHTSFTVTVGQTTLSGLLTGAPLWFWGGVGALAAVAVVGSALLLRKPKTPKP
jgi:PKD repeat protein